MLPIRHPLAACLALILGLASAGAAPDFYNVLLPDGADPWVIRHSDGKYYMTVTTGRDVTIRRSETLSGLGAGESRVAWRPPASGPASRNLWSSAELHHLRGKWYVYFAADDGENAHHRMYVLENPNPDPFEPGFAFRGKVADPGADRWAIDGTAFEAAGRLYFAWSGWEGDRNVRQDLYIAPMASPTALSGPRVRISRPDLPWETVGDPDVNEGPEVVVRGGTVSLVYSASGSWTDDYCLGLLRADAGADLLDPASWKKSPEPVFRGGNGVDGPGHASFARSPDGREDWIIYHAARFPGSGWTRNVRAQRCAWDSAGGLRLGPPAPPGLPIPLPGGEPAHDRYQAEDARLAGRARRSPDPGALGGARVGSIASPESHVEFVATARRAGRHVLAVRFANETPGGGKAGHRLTINGADAGPIPYPDSGPGRWSNAFRTVDLKPGPNLIRLGPGEGLAALDCIDLTPAGEPSP